MDIEAFSFMLYIINIKVIRIAAHTFYLYFFGMES